MGVRLVIVGGGISGLSLAYFLSEKPGFDIRVLEAEARPGGKIWTDRADGFLCESGVNGFLDNKPRTLELAGRLDLSPLRSSDAARKRYIYSGKRLNLLPESPPAFFKSGLVSLPGKLRIAIEPFIRKGSAEDETLADFARRRLGREAYEKLIDPMASGIYAGDPEAMSLKSSFPRIHEIEQKYGSLIRGMIKLMAERKKAVSAAPGGVLTSFPGGMQALIDSLRERLGGRLSTASRAVAVEKKTRCYAVHLSEGPPVEAEAVVLAVPAHQAMEILKDLSPEASRAMGAIPYPSLAVVCTGFRRDKLPGDVNAFGFLVPFGEGRKILGTLFDSSIFPGRSPEGQVLLRTMVGGARASRLADAEESKIADTVLSELRDVAGIRAGPDFLRVYRHDKAIPQYTVGHSERARQAEELTEKFKGLYVTGNALRGIGVNDCIENSYKLAERIAAHAG